MTTLKEMFPSDYLKADDLKGKDVTLTVDSVAREELYIPGKGAEWAWIIYFKEAIERHKKDPSKPNKRLFCNPTNARSIFTATGTEHMEDWPGKRITIYATTTMVKRKSTPCIRVREGGK